MPLPFQVDGLSPRNGWSVGLVVNAGGTVTATDFNGRAETAGARFALGRVLDEGDTVVPFGAQLYAVPVSSLWR